MNIILMTILLTLLGAGLVVLIVWSGIVSWKSIKFKRETLKHQKEYETSIDDYFLLVNQRIDELDQILNQNGELIENNSNQIEQLKSSIDSRFDKQFSKIDEIKNVLNKKD